MTVDNHIDVATKTSTWITYIFGAGTFIGDTLNFLDVHGVAIGAACSIIALITNIYFQNKRFNLEKDKNG